MTFYGNVVNAFVLVAVFDNVETRVTANVCQKRAVNSDIALLFGRRCLFANRTPVDFIAAMAYCKESYDNGRLAIITERAVPKVVQQWLRQASANDRVTHWWVGLLETIDTKTQADEWFWINADFTVNATATTENTPWLPNQLRSDRAQRFLGLQNCGALATHPDDRSMTGIKNVFCVGNLWTICETAKPLDKKLTANAAQERSNSSSGTAILAISLLFTILLFVVFMLRARGCWFIGQF